MKASSVSPNGEHRRKQSVRKFKINPKKLSMLESNLKELAEESIDQNEEKKETQSTWAST